MKNNLIFLALLAFLLTSCATPSIKQNNPIGKVYKDSVQLRNKTIPLLEGEWKVIGRGFSGMNNEYFQLVLIKETERREMHSSIIIATDTLRNSYIGYLPCKYCNRMDVHHIAVKNNARGGAQDCWLINHYQMSVNPKRQAIKEAYNYMISNHCTIPKIMIESFHRFTGKHIKSKMLEVRYYYNPEVQGFEPPTDPSWGTSDWHPLQIQRDPKKFEYIKILKKEGAIMHERIREGFGE